MVKKGLFILAFILISIGLSAADDTIRVMQYNLLYYDMNTSWCSSVNNNVDQKDIYLQTITSHYKPDIFTVNEMNGSITSVDRLLNNIFNVDGLIDYKRANYTGNYLVNMLYYNTQKLALKSQDYILTSPRITDVYHLYHLSENLAKGDTVFLTCIVSHLKAGSNPTDAQTRAEATQRIMAYINNKGIDGNVMLMGDLNLYTSSELAFQNLISPTPTGFQFYDPVNAIGEWHDNPDYSQYHTQSTSTEGGCPAGGGMDDRFDFILASQSILDGANDILYIENSYWAYGQDGLRLNKSLIDEPTNTSLPFEVINALYNMSDHLPVVMKLLVNSNPSFSSIATHSENKINVINPIEDTISLWMTGNKSERVRIDVINMQGKIVATKRLSLYPEQKESFNVSNLPSGFYIIRTKGKGFVFVNKIVKR